ncbi:SAM-dependent methyltransferase [Nitrobacteraceae bacterium AZCC 2146]
MNVTSVKFVQQSSASYWKDDVQCPRCGCSLKFTRKNPTCSNSDCVYSETGFPKVGKQPVLIDFEDSVFERSAYEGSDGAVFARDISRRSIGSRIHRFINGENPIAKQNCERFLNLLRGEVGRPRILVIGGGTIGSGADKLYSDPAIELINTDVYASEFTELLVDGHKLPFKDGSFDGVWVQAVLEHVLEPAVIVAEIHRVLGTSGIVYAETPFMQQVHERAYDFTRFTQSGHRWLFRRFEEISAGPVTGAGVVMLWSIRYFARALGAGDKLSRLVSLPFFWLRYFDLMSRGRKAADAAGGLFFLGRRSDKEISARSMLQYYANQK